MRDVDVVAALLKVLGLMGLGAGLLGLMIGGSMMLFGPDRAAQADALVGSGASAPAQDTQDQGVAVAGTSLLVAGLGLVLFVAGLSRRQGHATDAAGSTVGAREPPRAK